MDVNEAGVTALAEEYQAVTPYVCNLADPAEVNALAQTVRSDLGPVDGLIHLVGGWRGGDGIPGQQDQDWDVLHTSVLTTLRNTSRAFYQDLESSEKGRLANVSSVTASKPTACGAAYSAIKARVGGLVSGCGRRLPPKPIRQQSPTDRTNFRSRGLCCQRTGG